MPSDKMTGQNFSIIPFPCGMDSAESAASAPQLKCGEEAVQLLNCLVGHGPEKCAAQVRAFSECAAKAKLKQFVLVEECPTSTPADTKSKEGSNIAPPHGTQSTSSNDKKDCPSSRAQGA